MKAVILFKIIILALGIHLFQTSSRAQFSGGGAIPAVDENTLAGGGRVETDRPAAGTKSQASGKERKNPEASKTTRTTYKKPAPKPRAAKKFDGFTIGGDDFLFNFEIVRMVQPIHTLKAQEAGAKGLVQVEILIDVDGSVLQARARSGNKLLHPEAEKAALMTKFRQFSVYGKPARAFGFIVFRFGKRDE